MRHPSMYKRSKGGNDDPVRGGYLFPLPPIPRLILPRKSPRLLNKALFEELKKLDAPFHTSYEEKMKKEKKKDAPIRIWPGGLKLAPGSIQKRDRRLEAEKFQRDYPSTMDKRTWLLASSASSDPQSHSFLDKSYGIMWIAVYWMKNICVVTRKEQLDMTHVRGSLKFQSENVVRQLLRRTLLYEVEELTFSATEFRRLFALDSDESPVQPFSVVSVISGDDVVCKHAYSSASSSPKYDEKKASMVLQKLMENNMSTMDEFIQAAIDAFQHLFCREFLANEIEVAVRTWINECSLTRELSEKDMTSHLRAINGV